jgi:hypothetical protein
LHELLSDGGTSGLGVTLGWLTGVTAAALGCHVWIGRSAWPASTVLERSGLLEDALLIDARTPAERAWAAELCVKCQAVAAVVADGRGLDLTMTRRLQLAVRDRDCRLIVLRPVGEAGSSAAGSRWKMTPTPAAGDPVTGNSVAGNPVTGNPVTGNPVAGDPPRRPRWSVELIRHKGSHRLAPRDAFAGQGNAPFAGLRTAREMFCHDTDTPTAVDARHGRATHWIYEWDPHAGRGVPVDVPADVADGSPAAALAWTG